jgi:RNA polymerase sigma-70 factor (ECF subfamily)
MFNQTKKVSALEAVIRQDGKGLMAYARTITNNTQDAEDAIQEALSRVLSRRLDPIENLRAYVYKSVRGAALNNFRSRIRRERREREAASAPLCVFQEPASRREEINALNQALTLLPKEQQEVVILKIWGGLSFSQIADVVGSPRDTAASRYRYAVTTLKREMKEVLDHA